MLNGRILLRRTPFIIVLLLVSLQGVGQKPRQPWLTIEPIQEKPRFSQSNSHHDGDTTFLIVDSINIYGNRKTKSAIVLRYMNLYPGDTLYADSLNALLEEKRQLLLNSSLFLTVNIYPVNTSAHRTDLNIEVLERQYFLAIPLLSLADRNFNVWWVDHHHDLGRLNYGIKVYQNNLTGKNDRLDLTIQHGYTRKYSLQYQLPYFDKAFKQGAGVFVSYSHAREVNYATDSNKQVFLKQDYFLQQQFSFGVHYIYKKAIRLQHKLTLSYNSYSVKDTILKLNPRFFPDENPVQKYLELSYNFTYTGADIWAYPLHGFNINATVSRLGLGLLGKVDETILTVDGSKFWQFFPKTYGSTRFMGNIHFHDHQPYFLLKGMGYNDHYLRGLEYFVIEGNRFGVFRNTIKREVLALRVHSRLLPQEFSTIPIHVYLKLYGDFGYNHSSYDNNSLLNNKLLYTYGLGADIVTFYDAVLRVEYSINQLGQKGLFLHFKSAF